MKLTESEEKFRKISEKAHDAIVMMGPDKCISFWNAAAERMFGYTTAEALGREMHPLLAPHANESFNLGFEHFQRTGTGPVINKVLQLTARCKNGSTLDVEITVSPLRINGLWNALGIFRDITEHKAAEDKIHQMALYDELTQLPNRRLLIDRLEQAMEVSKRSQRFGAVLFVDLDLFKTINDVHGHDVGDLLLKEVGDRISACLRKTDTVARFGGDEFVVVLSELAENESESVALINSLAENIRESLSRRHQLHKKNVDFFCTASIGATLFGEQDANVDVLLKCADRAMYQAKKQGGNQVSLY
jgi:diguanylate cyclase (GGDEF)-like protein/PAS domain S-box-containing protein